MLKVESTFNGVILIAPIVIGAFLSGIFYLAEGAAIPFTIFQIALILAFILFVLRQILLQKYTLEVYGLEVYYLLLFGIIFFSILYTPEREQALFLSFRMIILFLMTYLIYNVINTEKELRMIGYIIIAAALIVAMQSLLQFYINPEIAAFNYANQGEKLLRGEGTESDPNIFASNLIPAIMLLGAYFGHLVSVSKRIFAFTILGLLFAAVLLTYSRSSWVAIAIGLILIMGIQKKFGLLFYLFIAFFVTFLVSETVQRLTFSVITRFIDIFAGETDDSSRYRIVLAKTAILMILDTYLLGVGYQGFSSAFKDYHPPQETAGIFEPHNEFYSVFAELGIIGFILFLMILWNIFKKAKISLQLAKEIHNMNWLIEGLFATFISYLIFFQFLGGMLLHSLFIITISLIFCAHKITLSKSHIIQGT